MPEYDPYDHYWRKTSGRLYCSARDLEVEADDALCRQWLDGGGRPTPYPRDESGAESFDELMKILKPYGLGRTNRLKAELENLDLLSIRPLRAMAYGLATDDDRVRLAEIEARAFELRQELGGQG